jgi:hypothetical protein
MSSGRRVLMLGATGRVGGSTAMALSVLRPDLNIVVGGRNRYVPFLRLCVLVVPIGRAEKELSLQVYVEFDGSFCQGERYISGI